MSSEPFNFWYDKKAYDLEGLILCLRDMSDEEFSSYVNSSKNDFANWIEGSLQNIELAEKIRGIITKEIIAQTIKGYLHGEQNKVIIGSTNDVHGDSLVQEVMQKNEDFFRNAEEKIGTIGTNNYMGNSPENDSTQSSINGKELKDDIVQSLQTPSNADEKPKSSKLSLMDFPSLRKKDKTQSLSEKPLNARDHYFKQDFFAGLIFGIVIGGLLTLIALQLL